MTVTTTWTEEQLLDEFWRAQENLAVDRLQLLRLYAMVVVTRPHGWDPARIRDQFHRNPGLRSEQSTVGCFSCFSRSRKLHRHHVIQIQNNGSNDRRNLTAICDSTGEQRGASCHSTLHGWMTPSVDSHETTHVRLDAYVEALSQAILRPYRQVVHA